MERATNADPHEPRPADDVVGPDLRGSTRERALGDFTVPSDFARIIALGVVVGVISSLVALALLLLIALVTNLAYYQRWSFMPTSPAENTLGAAAVIVPVLGSLIVGLMAYFGSERIRGHGIPEAMETILVGGSKAAPRVAALKPASSAISIGTGGPFGAEGPIIMTGGALGSVLGQFFHLSAIQRRALLVAGAAAGMSAVFGTPVAAVVLGVELLVFEWRPRSLVPIAAASAVAAGMRAVFVAHGWMPPAPLFPVTGVAPDGPSAVAGPIAIGLLGGGLAWVLTRAVYGAEDLFHRLPIHWMWWPAIGGVVVGIGGLIEPRALGVGYASIGGELAGTLAISTLATLLIVKAVIWSVALGSGTSGGILAPVLMIGGALGGIVAPALHGGSAGVWAALGMAAVLTGMTRSPLTAIVFALEVTHDVDLLLPLLVVATIAYLLSVVLLPRSILTEKIARRGFHVRMEYGVEPFEALFVRDVMLTDIVSTDPDTRLHELYRTLSQRGSSRGQRLLPVVASGGALVGVVSWSDVLERAARHDLDGSVADVMQRHVDVTYPDETLREASDRMAVHRVGVLPVVERGRPDRMVGLLTQFNLLDAREQRITEERHRERVLRMRPLDRLRG
jgi:CIC family chloride channel protein